MIFGYFFNQLGQNGYNLKVSLKVNQDDIWALFN